MNHNGKQITNVVIVRRNKDEWLYTCYFLNVKLYKLTILVALLVRVSIYMRTFCSQIIV